jgi:hypothetical protein
MFSIILPSEVALFVGDHLAQPPLGPVVPRRLIDSFEGYREILTVYRVAAAIADPSRQFDLMRWAHLRQHALRVRNIESKAVFDRCSDMLNLSTERASCVAIEYFQQIMWLKDRPQRSVWSPFRHWDNAFDILQAVTKLESSCLTLWITFIAATVEVMVLQRDHQESVFARAFMKSVQCLNLRSCEETRHILLSFLYHETIFDPYLEVLMNAVTQIDGSLRVDLLQLGGFESKSESSSSQDVVSKPILTGHVRFEER